MPFSLPAFFRRSSQPPLLGADISASSVKLVELVPGSNGRMKLAAYAIEPIPGGAIVDGNIEQPEVVADALARAVKRAGSRTRQVAMALPTAAVITKKIALPDGLLEEDYEIQVENEASRYIPFPIEEVNLDFRILGPSDGPSGDVDVLLAASRKEKVEDRVAVAEAADLSALVIDVESFAARSAMDHVTSLLPGDGAGQILAFFDIGQTTTSMTVMRDGEMLFEREQAFGGQQLTVELMRAYGFGAEEAEQRKKTGDLPDDYLTGLLAPFVEQGATEVARSLQFFFTSTPHDSVDRIFLAGGCAVTQGLVEAVESRSQVPVELFSPFAGMEIASSVRKSQLQLDAPALMVACGLAMRRFDA